MAIIKTITTLKIDFMQSGGGMDFENIVPAKSAYAEYDRGGKVLMEIAYTTNGAIEQKCINTYNEQGKIIEEILYNDEGEIDERKTYKYNAAGNISEELLFYIDGSFDTTLYKYDDKENLTEKITTDPDGVLESKKIYSYDEKKDLLSEIASDSDGNIRNESHVVYDDKGNEIEISKFVAEDERTTHTKFEYDEQGKKSAALIYENDKLVSKYTYEANNKDQLEKIIEETLHGKSFTVIQYDDTGNMIEQLETNENGELNNRILRKFDEHNNLSEVAVTIDRHGMGYNQNYIIKYQYEYYD